MIQKAIHPPIPAPSWNGVRGIYKKLSDEFPVLTRAFDVEVSSETKTNLDHLIIAIDEVDNCIDELPSRAQRDTITKSLVDYLRNDVLEWSDINATPTLSLKIKNLKRVIQTQKVTDLFIDAAETIFLNTELKRHTPDVDEFIVLVTAEGRATATLPLSILGISADTPFGKFFTQLCALMGVADLIFDAYSDYRKGYTVLQPSIGLIIRLVGITIRDGWKLLVGIPHKFRFLWYCIRFGIALMRG